MTRPDSLFEAASYDLNKFIERRVAERRTIQREANDRRQQPVAQKTEPEISSSENTSLEQSISSH